MKQPILLKVDRYVLDMDEETLKAFIVDQMENSHWASPECENPDTLYRIDQGEEVLVVNTEEGVFLVTLGEPLEMRVS